MLNAIQTLAKKDFVARHWPTALNVYLFLCFLPWGFLRLRHSYLKNELGFTDIAFAIQWTIFLVVIMVRTRHRAVDGNLFHQFIALAAFYSGLLFIGQPPAGGAGVQLASKIVTAMANVLGALTLVTLGRSFGILIARREIKTAGVYSVVRHPMYGTDILLRVGFLIGHFNPFVIGLFIVSAGCYIWRALLEERFLVQDPVYREYMSRVRWRLIPGVF